MFDVNQILTLLKDGAGDVKEGLVAMEDISKRMAIVAENIGGISRSAKVLVEKAESLSKKMKK